MTLRKISTSNIIPTIINLRYIRKFNIIILHNIVTYDFHRSQFHNFFKNLINKLITNYIYMVNVYFKCKSSYYSYHNHQTIYIF